MIDPGGRTGFPDKPVNITGFSFDEMSRQDFKSDGDQGEINGVGLDTDSGLNSNWVYKIYGTQSWGITDHYGYGSDWQTYSLILDDFSGSFDRIVFCNDADASQATNVYYRNVRVVKTTSVEPTITLGSEETP